MDHNLIFDIGLHTGHDALYYLRKGFRVVGLEARSDLCEQARAAAVDAGLEAQLKVVQRALYYRSDETVSFFINDNKDDWGSLFRGSPEQDGSTARETTVETISLYDLIDQFGVPYYIKCDIEGGDSIFAEQLIGMREKPSFVSIEATKPEDVAKLSAAGYNAFQVRNQYMNVFIKEPHPSQEGKSTDQQFTHAMSGPFGRDLPADGWTSFGAAIDSLLTWYRLRDRDKNLAIGWLDIHATVR